MVTIDQIFKNLGLNKIDILKIDTQGFEDKVLEGCRNLLKIRKLK